MFLTPNPPTNQQMAGWWFGTFFIFPHNGNGIIIPIGELIFSREGKTTTNQMVKASKTPDSDIHQIAPLTTQSRSLLYFVVHESCCFTALTVATWALGMPLSFGNGAKCQFKKPG